MAKYEVDGRYKLGDVRIKINDSEVKSFLKSDGVKLELLKVAKDVQKAFLNLDEDGKWKVKYWPRPSRATFVVSTDDNDAKWREVKRGRLARWVRRNLIKGKASRPGRG